MGASESQSFDDPVRDLEEIRFGNYHGKGSLRVYVPGETNRHFRDLKHETRRRLGRDDLSHGEFLQMLLDCWSLNLEGAGRDE